MIPLSAPSMYTEATRVSATQQVFNHPPSAIEKINQVSQLLSEIKLSYLLR
jgi:hypothetical protein